MNEKDKCKQPNCKYCNKLFIPNRSGQIYCNRSCKDKQKQEERRELTKARREERLKKKMLRQDKFMSQSPFSRYLISEVKRAGTLEILANQTSESLLELLRLTRLRTKYSGITDGKVNEFYELSHIVAVKDKTRLGILHPSNIIISPRNYNRARGKKVAPLGVGASIDRRNLLAKYKVGADEKGNEVLNRIRDYLGVDTLNGFYLQSNLTLTRRNALVERLNKYSNRPNFPDLSNMDNEELALLLLKFGESSSHTFSKPSFSELEVALNEMIRNNKQGSVLFWVVEELNSSMEFGSTSNLELLADFRDFQDFVLKQVWNQLHHEPYSLAYADRHVIECFALNDDVDPVTKLEIALASRRARLQT